MKLEISILAGCSALLVATAAWPQAKPAAPKSPFEGKWSAQSVQCTPAGNTRFSPMTIRGTKFTIKYTRDGRSLACDLNIAADGSFDNKTCEAPTSGKFSGDNLNLTVQSQERICKVAFTRDKT
ncbi:hypothetical protein SAMN02990966_06591 [Rhodospirillales bacterium URHD0017]|nr:hypothetical protein SAMN02990966_06591 [Rhodospirillales bacterium URHD0017]